MIFKGFPDVRSCLRPVRGPLNASPSYFCHGVFLRCFLFFHFWPKLYFPPLRYLLVRKDIYNTKQFSLIYCSHFNNHKLKFLMQMLCLLSVINQIQVLCIVHLTIFQDKFFFHEGQVKNLSLSNPIQSVVSLQLLYVKKNKSPVLDRASAACFVCSPRFINYKRDSYMSYLHL